MEWSSFLENVAGCFAPGGSSSAKEKKTRSRKRSLQIETLEDRDLLSVTPIEPLALDFLADTTAIVFTPPVLVSGTDTATTITTTATTLETGDGAILVGTLTQTFDITVEIAMCTTTNAWTYTETVAMSYTETFDGATFWGGSEYVFTAWSNATGTGFTFDSTAQDDHVITLSTNDGLLTITGFATSLTTIVSSSNPDFDYFGEHYENSATQITEFQGASGTFDTFEHASSTVGNFLLVTTLANGNVETILGGYETVTLQYSGNGLLTSEMATDGLVPTGSSFALTNFVSTVEFSYAGLEFYATNYEIVSLETPTELLSLTGSSSTTVFSFQNWSDSASISYTLIGADGTYDVSTGNGAGGTATSNAAWSSELNASGDWILIDGNSHVFGNDFTSLFSEIAFYSVKSEQETTSDGKIIGNYTVSGTNRHSESEAERYDIVEAVSGGEWSLVSGFVSSQFERTTANSTTITGTLTITSGDTTVTWDTSSHTGASEGLDVEMVSETNASGNWITTGTRNSHTSGSEASTLTASQQTYQNVVNGMSITGTSDQSERNRVDYHFSIEESFSGGEWGAATGSGWTQTSAKTTTEWSANSEVSKSYGTKLNSNGVKDAWLLGSTPLNSGETKIVITGTFTESGFESQNAEGHLEFTLINGEWQSTSGTNVLTTTRMVMMDHELTTNGGVVTITETGFVNDRSQVVVGYDAEWNAKWGQATIGYEEFASITVDYANDSLGSDTFASSHYVYNAALVLMRSTSSAESYANKQIVQFEWGIDSPNTGLLLFAAELEHSNNNAVDLEWQTIFWDKTFTTVQEVKRSQSNSAAGTSSSNGSRTEVTITDSGGMMDNFSANESGGTSYNGPSDDGNGGTWTPGTQTYRLVDNNDWNITTILVIDGMTGLKTLIGNVETTFFSVGDGTAWEKYNFTNTETGSVSSSSETLAGNTHTVRSSSYSFSNSITEFYHTDFVYCEVDDNWLIVGGNGEASGARSWSSNASTQTTTENLTQDIWSFGWSSESSFSGMPLRLSSSASTSFSNSGSYSDTWSSESAYLNGEWVLTGGTMTGSGSTTSTQSSQADSVFGYDVVEHAYCFLTMIGGTDYHFYGWVSLHESTANMINASFTISQTVENGAWVMSDKLAIINETSASVKSKEYLHFDYDIANDWYFVHHTGHSSDSHAFAGTKTFDKNGLASSEWTVERQGSMNNTIISYNELARVCDLDYHEHISSCGEWFGHYYYVCIFFSSTTVTDLTIDAGNISGEIREYVNGWLISQTPITSGYFQGSGSQSSGGGVNLSSAPPPAAPPPPPQKPAVPGTSGISAPVGTSFLGNARAFAGAFLDSVGPAYAANLDNIQSTLDYAGFAPVVGIAADGANALISAGRGDWTGAGINAIAMVPFFGDKVKAGSMIANAGKGNASVNVSKNANIWSPGPPNNSVQNAYNHWQKHKAEFPELNNAKEYVDLARNMINNAPLTKTKQNGQTLHYAPSSNTFVAALPDGTPKTMFRPTMGMPYWIKQK